MGIVRADRQIWCALERYNKNRELTRLGKEGLHVDDEVLALANSLHVMCSLKEPFDVAMASVSGILEPIGPEAAVRDGTQEALALEEETEQEDNAITALAEEEADAQDVAQGEEDITDEVMQAQREMAETGMENLPDEDLQEAYKLV